MKQVKRRQVAKAIASKNTNPEVLQRLENVEVMLREMLTYVHTTHQPPNPNFASGMSETEGASKSISRTPINLNHVLNNVGCVHGNNNSSHVARNINGPAPGEKQNIILLGWEREDVAKGFIASHSTCHGRKMQDDEKIVIVSEVIKPDAPVYYGPQDGISFLCEIADGGFLIWGGGRIRMERFRGRLFVLIEKFPKVRYRAAKSSSDASAVTSRDLVPTKLHVGVWNCLSKYMTIVYVQYMFCCDQYEQPTTRAGMFLY